MSRCSVIGMRYSARTKFRRADLRAAPRANGWATLISMVSWNIFLVALLCAGCSDQTAVAPKKLDPAQRRAANAATLAAQVPKLTRHPMDGGELLVLEVPVDAKGRYVETRKCFVWRDTKFGNASMQCPSDESSGIFLPATQDDPQLR